MSKSYVRFTTSELIAYVKGFKFTRTLRQLHVHHTYLPNKAMFSGYNHDELQWGMENYHVNTKGWSDIAQHVTLFPDGVWLLGRDFDRNPASILGWNTGAFCIEMVGDFDINKEKLLTPQEEAMYEFCEFMVETKGLEMKFHRDSPTAYKTCPGSGLERDTFFENVINYTENKVAKELAEIDKSRRERIAELRAIRKERSEKRKQLRETIRNSRVVFNDLKDSDLKIHWVNEYANYLYDKRIIGGFELDNGDLEIRPDIPITRAEVFVIVAKAMESIEETIMKAIKPFDGKLNDLKDGK